MSGGEAEDRERTGWARHSPWRGGQGGVSVTRREGKSTFEEIMIIQMLTACDTFKFKNILGVVKIAQAFWSGKSKFVFLVYGFICFCRLTPSS